MQGGADVEHVVLEDWMTTPEYPFNSKITEYGDEVVHSHQFYETLFRCVFIVKAMVFPVVNDRCESWTIKKAEHRSIDGF